MAESNADKTEAPTPRRRQEAVNQGNIARSPDLTSSVLLIGGLFLMKWFGLKIVLVLRDILAHMLSRSSMADLNAARMGPQIVDCLGSVGMAMAPLLGGAMLIVILVNIAQVGLHFNGQRLQLNWSALNPVRGLNKIFSMGQGGTQMLMNLVKVLLVGAVGYSAVGSRLVEIIAVQRLSFIQIFGLGADVVFAIGLRVGILLFVLAILDYFYHRYRVEQSLKMTKQEVKDEMRSMDGDPLIKQRRRQIAIQRHMQRLKKDVPKASVVITNPTHYAVALQYEEGTMRAPKLVAKGVDFIALRIRELAVEAGIPIVERPPLARAIYRIVDVGQEIPVEFYSAVAEILAYVYELNRKAGRRVAV